MRLILLAIAVLLIPRPATGQVWYDANAATRYDRAYAIHQQRQAQWTERQWQLMNEFDGVWQRGPTPEVRNLIARMQPEVYLVRSAARQRLYWRDIRVEHGFGEFPPHLTGMRSHCRMLRQDFLVRLYNNDLHTSLDRIVTVLRMSEHLRSEQQVYSSLVACAVNAFADFMIDDMIDVGQFNAQHAQAILRATDLPERDPFDFLGAVEHHRLLTTQWLIDNYFGEGGLELLLEDNADFLSIEQFDADGELTQEEFEARVVFIDDLFQRGTAALADRDVERRDAALAEISEILASDDQIAPLASIVPDFRMLASRMDLAEKFLSDRRQKLQEIIDGNVDPRAQANAAVLYVRAAQALIPAAGAALDEISRYAHANDQPPNDAVRKALIDPAVVMIIDEVRFASELSRCDFNAVQYDNLLLDRHQHEIRRLAELLRADAARLLHSGEIDAAADRKATQFRLIRHLTTDPVIGSALTAHMLFDEAQPLLNRLVQHERFAPSHRHLLLRTIRPLDGPDPFGYQASLDAARDRLRDWQIYSGPHESLPTGTYVESPTDEAARDHLESVRRFFEHLTDDQVVHFQAIFDRWIADYRASIPLMQELTLGYEHVIDVPALLAVHATAQDTLTQLQASRFASWPASAPMVPVIPNLAARMAAAPKAVDACIAMLEP